MSSTALIEILQEQLDEAQRQDNYVPSASLKKLIDVSTSNIVSRKKMSKKKSKMKHAKRVKKRRRLAK